MCIHHDHATPLSTHEVHHSTQPITRTTMNAASSSAASVAAPAAASDSIYISTDTGKTAYSLSQNTPMPIRMSLLSLWERGVWQIQESVTIRPRMQILPTWKIRHGQSCKLIQSNKNIQQPYQDSKRKARSEQDKGHWMYESKLQALGLVTVGRSRGNQLLRYIVDSDFFRAIKHQKISLQDKGTSVRWQREGTQLSS